MKAKYKIGDRVIYRELIAKILDVGKFTDGKPAYGLEAEENKELTCTAKEEELELYIDQEINQNDALFMADLNSIIIRNAAFY